MGSATSSTHAKKKVVDPRTQLYIKPSPRAPETDGAAMATIPCSAMELKLKVRKTPGLDLQSAAVAALKLPLTLAGVLPAWTAKQLAAEAEVAFCAAGLVIQVRRCFFLFFFLGGGDKLRIFIRGIGRNLKDARVGASLSHAVLAIGCAPLQFFEVVVVTYYMFR